MAFTFSRIRRGNTRFTSLSSTVRARYLSLSVHPKPSEDPTPDPRFLRHSSPQPKFTDHSPFLRFPEVHVTTLPNGIRVATQTAPTSTSYMATIGVWVDAGSRFEEPGTNGTAHFLEHMIFKGTHRRPTHRSIEEEMENMGGCLNAYTTREQTNFFADVQCRDVPVAIDVLADMLQNSRFANHAIKRERVVILREREEVQGQTEEVVFDHLHEASFPGHPLGSTILGPEENIRAISKVDLQRYISTHYTGPRMVISAAGAIDHDEIVKMVSKLFKKFSGDPTTADQLVDSNPAAFKGSQIKVDNEDMPLAHFAVAFEGASYTDPNSIPLMVIQSLLGSWNKSMGVGNFSGSELARRVSTDGLAESIMAFNTNYRDTGLFGIYVTAMPDCLEDLSRVIMQQFRRLAYELTEEEIIRAKNQIKAALLLHIDGSTAVAENNGRQMLTYRRAMPFLELFARIDAVDAATVREIAINFIIDKDVAVAAVGPLQRLPDHNWFRSRTRHDMEIESSNLNAK